MCNRFSVVAGKDVRVAVFVITPLPFYFQSVRPVTCPDASGKLEPAFADDLNFLFAFTNHGFLLCYNFEMMNDVLGEALQDYQQGNRRHKLWIYNKYGDKEAMPVATYFRKIEAMSPLEVLTLEGCTGDILDIGAAAGCHSLLLQQQKHKVTALDISAGATSVLRQRGIKKVVQADIFTYNKKQFDTLLFLMNGIGLAGTLQGLQQLLHTLQKILKPGGHIVFDSSDVQYLYSQTKLPAHYYGEIDYRYAYRGQFSEWFTWLYIDQTTMAQTALDCGFKMEVLMEEASGVYLGRLRRV